MTEIVIITGAASGIGAACVMRMLDDGYQVVAVDLSREGLKKLENRHSGAKLYCCSLDVTDGEAVKKTVRKISKRGKIHGIINSAGIGQARAIAETTPDFFRKMLDINVVGSFNMAQAALEYMSTGGAIIFVASVSGLRGNRQRVAYGASKGAVISMTKDMAAELGACGIRVNALAPGPVDTPMVKAMHSQQERARWISRVPLGRYAETEEIAGVASFLMSADASYVTGHILAVDGGFSASGLGK